MGLGQSKCKEGQEVLKNIQDQLQKNNDLLVTLIEKTNKIQQKLDDWYEEENTCECECECEEITDYGDGNLG